MKPKWLVFGRVPPPHGGVTISVENLLESLHSVGVEASLVSFKNLLCRYQVAHINYSRPIFRFIAVFWGYIFCKKVIFVLHGENFNKNNIFNRGSVALATKIQVLNETAKRNVRSRKSFILPPVYEEGMVFEDPNPSPCNKRDILFYISTGNAKSIEFIYGVDYIKKIIEKFKDEFTYTIIDLSGEFKSDFFIHDPYVNYIDSSIDFKTALKKHRYYVRPTRTDGNSVAVIESLMMGTKVVASNCVDRPEGVIAIDFSDLDIFYEALMSEETVDNLFSLPSIHRLISNLKI